MEKEEKVTLNGKEISKKDLENLKENQDKNTKIVETNKNEFVQRLKD